MKFLPKAVEIVQWDVEMDKNGDRRQHYKRTVFEDRGMHAELHCLNAIFITGQIGCSSRGQFFSDPVSAVKKVGQPHETQAILSANGQSLLQWRKECLSSENCHISSVYWLKECKRQINIQTTYFIRRESAVTLSHVCPWMLPHMNLQQIGGIEKHCQFQYCDTKKNQIKIFFFFNCKIQYEERKGKTKS